MKQSCHWITCDGCGDDGAGFASVTITVARLEARRHGWRNRGSKDFCPRCAAADTPRRDQP